MSSPSCPLCNRKSLLIYPVRYAVACPLGADLAPGLDGKQFKIDPRAPQTAGGAKYTLRALRTGYLYTYDEKRKRLKAYMVLEDGILWNFTPGLTPPSPDNENELTRGCTMNGDTQFQSLGRCIDVEHTPEVKDGAATNLWIGWSNVQWTQKMVAWAADHPEWRKLHMQCINIPAMLAGTASDTGEFQAFHKKIAHFAMNEQALKCAFEFSNRPIASENKQRIHAKSIADKMAQSPHKKGFILAVNDPLGIINDLSELTVPNLHNGFDAEVYWKSITATLLEHAENGIRAQASEMTGLAYRASKSIAEVNKINSEAGYREPAADMGVVYRVIRGAFETGSLDKALKDEDQKAQDIPEAQKQAAEKAWKDVSTKLDGSGNRVSLIDIDALKIFNTVEFPNKLKTFQPRLKLLTQAHAAWLKCDLFSQWMAGVHDKTDIRSGYAFSESLSQAIGNAVNTEDCQKILYEWLSQADVSNVRNLFARALAFNNDQLMNATKNAAETGDVPPNILDIYKEVLDRTAPNGQSSLLHDRLLLTTANIIAKTMIKGTYNLARGLIVMRMKLMSEGALVVGHLNYASVRNWILQEAHSSGANMSHQSAHDKKVVADRKAQSAVVTRASDPHFVGLEMDLDMLRQTGRLEDNLIREVRVPGVDTARNWLRSRDAKIFNLGVVTTVVQLLVAMSAFNEKLNSDKFSDASANRKLIASCASVLGTISETLGVMILEQQANEINHPLSAYLVNHWQKFSAKAKWMKYGGKYIGAAAGAFLAVYDVFNAIEAKNNGQKGLAKLYGLSAASGFYLAACAIWGTLPGFWPVLIATIIVGIVISIVESSAMRNWISRCKFSRGINYDTLEKDLEAFVDAVGG